MSLQEKLHKKLKDKQSLRSVGANPRMTKVRNMMGEEEYEENKEMLLDMQNDIKGNKKAAKKCVKNMMSGMDEKEMNDLSKVMKSKSPESSKELNNIIGSKRKIKPKEPSIVEITEPKCYIPASQRIETNVNTIELLKKPKKQFAKIQMTIPKITDLKSVESNTKISKVPSVQPFESFSKPNRSRDLETLFTNSLPYENIHVRLKCISSFNSQSCSDSLQLHIMQNGGKLVKIIKVIGFPKQKYIGVPGSETLVEKPLKEWDGKDILCLENYSYKMVNNETVRTENCVVDCETFMEKLTNIRNWLISLENTCVGLESLCEIVNKFGIIQKPNMSDSILVFHCYCKEYPNNLSKILVPQFPFVYIKIKIM